MIGKTSPTTTTLDDSGGRADWVRPNQWLRLILALRWGGVALTVGVVVWMAATSPPRSAQSQAAPPSAFVAATTMTNPRLNGRFKDGRPYAVAAQRAIFHDRDQSILLEGVASDIETPSDGNATVSARTGLFRQDTEHMQLTGDVVARTASGYQLETNSAEIWNAEAGIAARGEAATTISGPQGVATADGFEAPPGLNRARLLGAVKMRLNEGAVN